MLIYAMISAVIVGKVLVGGGIVFLVFKLMNELRTGIILKKRLFCEWINWRK